MTNLKNFALGLTALACCSSAALAEPMNANQSWYLAPSVSILNPDNNFGVDKQDQGAGIRVGKAVNPMWDVQMGTTYSRIRDNGVRYQQNLLGADGLLMFSRDRFRPFILVGAGAEYDKKDAAGTDTSKVSPYINAGLGFQFAFNDKLALQADYRRVHGFLRGNSFGASNSDNDYLTVGLNITFGPH